MSEHTHPEGTSALGLTLTLLALLGLAALSLALRYAHLGDAGYGVGLGIAVIKGALVAVFFMEILVEKVTVRVAFATCLSLFALLLSLMLADVLTRSVAPLQNPAGTALRHRG